MSQEELEMVAEPGQSWIVDLFRPEDAEGVVRLFHAVYGEDYPIKTFIDPDRLIAENTAGRTISSVARTPKGDIVGHNAFFRSAPYDRIYEGGAGLVLPTYRGGDIAARLLAHGQRTAAEQFGAECVFGEPVCNHIYMQKICVKLGWVSCALEVDLMPAEAYTKEQSAGGRVSALLDFYPLKERQQTVFLPDRYADQLRFLYQGVAEERRMERSAADLPAQPATRIVPQIFGFAQVARLAVHEAGADFDAVFAREEATAVKEGSVVIQAWLKLSFPWMGTVVERLRGRGYFLGGLLPRWFDEDGLLVQKVLHQPGWDGIQIYSERAAAILEMVKADWAGQSESTIQGEGQTGD